MMRHRGAKQLDGLALEDTAQREERESRACPVEQKSMDLGKNEVGSEQRNAVIDGGADLALGLGVMLVA